MLWLIGRRTYLGKHLISHTTCSHKPVKLLEESVELVRPGAYAHEYQ